MIINYHPADRAVVRLAGPLTQESATEAIDAMEHAREDCFYDRIEMALSSAGGGSEACGRILACIDALRADGVRIDASASGFVHAAGAFLLSLGDGRRALPECRLRYRLWRMEGEASLTAAEADGVAAALGGLDGGIVARLAERGVEAARAAGKRRGGADGFSAEDGAAAALFLAARAGSVRPMDRDGALKGLRERIAREALDADSLAETYRTLFAMDLTISPALAREFLLVDRIGRSRGGRRARRRDSVAVPEWEALWPGGLVDRRHLRRHALILGETGSGKTVSGVMPLVGAALAPGSGVGCALIVDPKRDLLPTIRARCGDARMIEPSRAGRPGSVLNLATMSEGEIDGDLKEGRLQDAARRILIRSAELAAGTPAAVWAGMSSGASHNSYWEHEGGSLACLALSLALAAIARRREIFAGPDSAPSILSAPPQARDALRGLAEAAGIVAPQDELRLAVERALAADGERRAAERERLAAGADDRRRRMDDVLDRAFDEGAAAIRRSLRSELGEAFDEDVHDTLDEHLDPGLRRVRQRLDVLPPKGPSRPAPKGCGESWEALAAAARGTELHASDAGFRRRFGDLDREVAAAPERIGLREAADRVLLCALHAPDDAEARPSPNVMAVAQRALDLLLTPAPGGDGGRTEAFGSGEEGKRKGPRLPASHLARALRPLFGPEAEPVWQDVRRWETLAASGNGDDLSTHYAGILAFAHQAFRDFAAPAPAWTLYFGVEPYWRRLAAEGSERILDFADAVDADGGRRVWVIQPKRGADRESLVAKAVKAAYFEAVLGNEARSEGREKPLVAYVADEFHRFVTAGEGHGEQGFLDACRSFGAFCALASQSVASIEFALAGADGGRARNEAAVSILLNNVGTKLFFRTTDDGTIRRIRRLCPAKPGRPAAVDVRPPSTLAPGECYAALPDGRFERRRLAPCLPGESGRAADGGGKAKSGRRLKGGKAQTAEVVPLFGRGEDG